MRTKTQGPRRVTISAAGANTVPTANTLLPIDWGAKTLEPELAAEFRQLASLTSNEVVRLHALVAKRTAERPSFHVWADRLATADPWSHRRLRRAMIEALHQGRTAIEPITLESAQALLAEAAERFDREHPNVEPSRWKPRKMAILRESAYCDRFFRPYPRESGFDYGETYDPLDPGPEPDRSAPREPRSPQKPKPKPGIAGRVVA